MVCASPCDMPIHALDGLRPRRVRTLDKRTLRGCMYTPLLSAYHQHGCRQQPTGCKITSSQQVFGDISYPLYITHFPFVCMQIAWAEHHQDAPLSTHMAMGVSIVILSVLTAYAAHRLYDLPVREWLKQKLFRAKVS